VLEKRQGDGKRYPKFTDGDLSAGAYQDQKVRVDAKAALDAEAKVEKAAVRAENRSARTLEAADMCSTLLAILAQPTKDWRNENKSMLDAVAKLFFGPGDTASKLLKKKADSVRFIEACIQAAGDVATFVEQLADKIDKESHADEGQGGGGGGGGGGEDEDDIDAEADVDADAKGGADDDSAADSAAGKKDGKVDEKQLFPDNSEEDSKTSHSANPAADAKEGKGPRARPTQEGTNEMDTGSDPSQSVKAAGGKSQLSNSKDSDKIEGSGDTGDFSSLTSGAKIEVALRASKVATEEKLTLEEVKQRDEKVSRSGFLRRLVALKKVGSQEAFQASLDKIITYAGLDHLQLEWLSDDAPRFPMQDPDPEKLNAMVGALALLIVLKRDVQPERVQRLLQAEAKKRGR